MRDWAWKVADREQNPSLNLRYEPGNWGDVLKGTWAVVVGRSLGPGFAYLDPFAGAPDYPLLQPVAERLEPLRGSLFVEAQEPFLREGRLASTASLVAGLGACLEVFDRDEERRSRWPSVLPLQDAEEALDVPGPHQLILWDPYDFFEHWSRWIKALVARARECPVLIYLYNKSPRGVSQARQYEDMRRRLAGVPHLAGRIPSDARLPRAYHEMLLLDQTGLLARVKEELRRHTLALAGHLAQAGAFEGGSGSHPGVPR